MFYPEKGNTTLLRAPKSVNVFLTNESHIVFLNTKFKADVFEIINTILLKVV